MFVRLCSDYTNSQEQLLVAAHCALDTITIWPIPCSCLKVEYIGWTNPLELVSPCFGENNSTNRKSQNQNQTTFNSRLMDSYSVFERIGSASSLEVSFLLLVKLKLCLSKQCLKILLCICSQWCSGWKNHLFHRASSLILTSVRITAFSSKEIMSLKNFPMASRYCTPVLIVSVIILSVCGLLPFCTSLARNRKQQKPGDMEYAYTLSPFTQLRVTVCRWSSARGQSDSPNHARMYPILMPSAQLSKDNSRWRTLMWALRAQGEQRKW